MTTNLLKKHANNETQTSDKEISISRPEQPIEFQKLDTSSGQANYNASQQAELAKLKEKYAQF